MYTLQLSIPGLPKTTNQLKGKHFRVWSNESKLWRNMVGLYLSGKKPKKPLNLARIECVRYSSKQPDFDGTVSTFKWIIDGLVEHRVLKDDNPNIIVDSVYRWKKCSPSEGHIEIKVEEVTETQEAKI